MSFDSEQLARHLGQIPHGQRLRVAYSGGVDSHCLLHALAGLCRLRPDITLTAIHIHHGLSPNADDWASHCQRVCRDLDIRCELVRVCATPKPGESPEAAARAARYAAFEGLITSGDWLLTAHHCDDQAETLLLQLLRGAGVRGLAAMAKSSPLGKGLLIRPLLGVARDEIKAYARWHDLAWIEDESNLNLGFDRNLLRHEIMPRLASRWPSAAATISRSAGHCAEALELLDALADEDLQSLIDADHCALSVSGLKNMREARQRNVLRYWIYRQGHDLPDARQLEGILVDVVQAAWDAVPCVGWSESEIRRYRDKIYLMHRLKPHDPSQVIPWTDLGSPLYLPSLDMVLQPGEGVGSRALEYIRHHGLSVTVRFRRGGEICRLPGKSHHQELKKLFQEHGVPPWLRERIPLIYTGERLIRAVGYFDCDFADKD